MSRISAVKKLSIDTQSYQSFDILDGEHPWQKQCPEGCVLYRTRILPHGKPVYFNYILAKEMGLIAENHPHEMTDHLYKKLVETFSLQIINEYDGLSQRKFDKYLIKPKPYMATRYLQLQHENKQGKTSGDGRGIWNGIVKHQGITWDVSSRGTGVTCLSPGAVEAKKPLKTGSTDFGYGCGQAELDELYGSAIFAEVLHLQGIPTERVLCIIDIGRGVGIGVRAAVNLLRPAHMFLYLKQNKFMPLKKSLDYFLKRQLANRTWKISKEPGISLYQKMLENLANDFSKFVAFMDIDYIFAWLDWDGDNVLANAGIIDYGSIRQFGIRHDQYRYDDVQRYSTNLNEQAGKAKLTIQAFCQCVDFIESGTRKSLKHFHNHSIVKEFQRQFRYHKSDRLLYRMGFDQKQRQTLLTHHFKKVHNFEEIFNYFDRTKIKGKTQKVPDGINHPALFNVPKIFRLLPKFILEKKSFKKSQDWITPISTEIFYQNILSKYASEKEKRNYQKYEQKIQEFQTEYIHLLKLISANESTLKDIKRNADIINSELRMTGNALIQIVNKLVIENKKSEDPNHIQKYIDQIIYTFRGFPETSGADIYKKMDKHSKKSNYFLDEKYRDILLELNEEI